jgi:hypothetical protein
MSITYPNGYSPKVEIRLLVAGRNLNVARIGRGQLELRDRIDLPPSEAEVVITVDGVPSSKAITLPNGIDASRDLVSFL